MGNNKYRQSRRRDQHGSKHKTKVQQITLSKDDQELGRRGRNTRSEQGSGWKPAAQKLGATGEEQGADPVFEG